MDVRKDKKVRRKARKREDLASNRLNCQHHLGSTWRENNNVLFVTAIVT